MICMRRTSHPPILGLGFPNGGFQIFDPAMKVIGRAEEKDRTSYFFKARRIAHRFQVEGGFRVTVTDSAAGRSRRLDALVRAGRKNGQFPAHGMPVHPELGTIDFRLPLQKGQPSTGSQGGKKP